MLCRLFDSSFVQFDPTVLQIVTEPVPYMCLSVLTILNDHQFFDIFPVPTVCSEHLMFYTI